MACNNKDKELVEMLLENHADISVTNVSFFCYLFWSFLLMNSFLFSFSQGRLGFTPSCLLS